MITLCNPAILIVIRSQVHLVGVDIFTSKKYEDLCPSTHNIDVPNVTRTEFQLVSIDEGFATLMNDRGDTRSDLKVRIA